MFRQDEAGFVSQDWEIDKFSAICFNVRTLWNL